MEITKELSLQEDMIAEKKEKYKKVDKKNQKSKLNIIYTYKRTHIIMELCLEGTSLRENSFFFFVPFSS